MKLISILYKRGLGSYGTYIRYCSSKVVTLAVFSTYHCVAEEWIRRLGHST